MRCESLAQSVEMNSKLLETLNLEGENLICIAGRPGMGKTSLALHMVLEYVKTSAKAVCIFCLEMSKEQIIDRLLIILSEVDSYRFRQKAYSDEEKERIELARKQLSRLNLIIDDTPILTVEEIEERIEGIDDLGLVVIDHDHLLCPDRKIKNREQECNEIGRQLKRLSKQKNVPIIITSHLSRRLECRRNKRPLMSDLNEIGVNANDMDTICFVYREGYYFPLEKHDEAEIIISQNKHGYCGTIPLKWQSEFMKFNYSDDTCHNTVIRVIEKDS